MVSLTIASLKGEDVVAVLEAIKAERPLPRSIKVDNGSEFISKAMDEARPHTALDWMTPAEFARGKALTPCAEVETEPEISTAERY